MGEIKKPISRVFSLTEARYLFERFEQIHCYKTNEAGEVIEQCPGWNWELEHVDDKDQVQRGGCMYRNTYKLCNNLQLAAEDHYVIEIRPKNEEDVVRERQQQRDLLENELRKLKVQRSEVEEKILAFENKLRTL